MKKYVILIVFLICFGLSIGLVGCTRSKTGKETQTHPVQLVTPDNLSISVTGRLMTVTWNAVDNARGYIIHTTSPGCGSGNRIVNTATSTVTSHTGVTTNSSSAVNGITDRGNGFVTFTGETSFTIWLMPETGSETEVMANSLIANIAAVGDGVTYTDSGQSNDVTLNKADYQPYK
ncbi:MAG: hypothetical protein FWG89_06590 [Treponema sp.]|nr:hypothetical protein [Treponema sp.]